MRVGPQEFTYLLAYLRVVRDQDDANGGISWQRRERSRDDVRHLMVPTPFVYLDEYVRLSLATRLRLRGFTIFTARDVGLVGTSDREQHAYAPRRRWLIISHNTGDFIRLHQRRIAHSGMI